MSRVELDQPLFAGGIRSPSFFNGRLLTGEDLSRERAATREQLQRLGHAVGPGVVCGLEVSKDKTLNTVAEPVLLINEGLAINELGQTLSLKPAQSLALVRPRPRPEPALAPFDICEPRKAAPQPAKIGLWLLVMSPVEEKEGRTTAQRCGGPPD